MPDFGNDIIEIARKQGAFTAREGQLQKMWLLSLKSI
jgi:hypothetical protein